MIDSSIREIVLFDFEGMNDRRDFQIALLDTAAGGRFGAPFAYCRSLEVARELLRSSGYSPRKIPSGIVAWYPEG